MSIKLDQIVKVRTPVTGDLRHDCYLHAHARARRREKWTFGHPGGEKYPFNWDRDKAPPYGVQNGRFVAP